jgi:hypothetical protein
LVGVECRDSKVRGAIIILDFTPLPCKKRCTGKKDVLEPFVGEDKLITLVHSVT